LRVSCTDVPGIDATGRVLVPLTSTGTVTIAVGDVNEQPSLEAGTVSVSESATRGTVLPATVTATDPDNNDMITFSINSGDSTGIFELSGTTAAGSGKYTTTIKVAKSNLDYETTQEYSLTIRATDRAGKYVDAVWRVQVTNVNEPPVFVTPAVSSVSEAAAAGTAVGARLSATDPESDSFSFSIVSGNTNNAFKLTSDGDMTVLGTLD